MNSKRIAILLFIFGCFTSGASATTNSVDLFSDNKITCSEMHKYPQKIFKENPDLGSGYGSPIEVEYECQGGLASLPFLKRILRLAERIRSEGGPQYCTGSIIHAHWRYYHFELLRAGLAPNLLQIADKDPDKSEKLSRYFEYWANQSPGNGRLYTEFQTERARAQILLTKYYRERFSFPQKKAAEVAAAAMSIIIDRATGSFTGADSDNDSEQLSTIAQNLRKPSVTASALREFLAAKPTQAEIDEGLKAALLTNKPLSIISLLVDNLEKPDYGDESALFFALRNKRYVSLLIEKGASVNYANGFGKTPLFYAVENNAFEIVQLLLARGANPNQTYKTEAELKKFECSYNIRHFGRSVLMHAAQHADVKIVRLLVKNGAKVEAVDSLGLNALDYAIQYQRQPNIDYLRSLGMKPSQLRPQ